jgi:hypothetical protein
LQWRQGYLSATRTLEGGRLSSTRRWSSQHIELAGIEPHELANFEERDPPLGHKTPDMPARHAESLGDAVDVQKWVASICPEN